MVVAIATAIAVPAFAQLSSSSTASATVVFADGFESGSFSQWTSSAGMTIRAGDAYEGAYAARAASTGSPAYAQVVLGVQGYDVVYEGRVNVLAQDPSTNVSLMRLRTSSGVPIMSIFRRKNGRLQTYNEVTGSSTTSKVALPTGGWHSLSVRVSVAGASGAYAVTLDGAVVGDLSTAADTGSTPVGRLIIGDPAAHRAFDVLFDSQTLSFYEAAAPAPVVITSPTTVAAPSSSSTAAPTTTAPPTTAPIVTTTVSTDPPTTASTSPPTTQPPTSGGTLDPAGPGGNVYVVSTGGSDANSGNASAPWRTFTRALPALRPGDALYARGGTYRERLDPTLAPASSGDAILVAAYPGERPVIQGVLWLHSPDYWTFDGINVTWDSSTGQPNEHMVKLIDGVGWTFRNGEVWGAHSYAAMLVAGQTAGEPANWNVSDNCIHDTYPTNNANQDQLIYANTDVNAGSGVIEHNLLFNATNGMGVKLGGADVNVGAATRVTVRYNTIYNTSQNILVSWRSHDNTIDHNLMDLTGTNYGSVRGYQLTGANNRMSNNFGYAAKMLLFNDAGYLGVQDSGNNSFPVNPQFDNTSSCAGFHPLNPAVAGYGR